MSRRPKVVAIASLAVRLSTASQDLGAQTSNAAFNLNETSITALRETLRARQVRSRCHWCPCCFEVNISNNPTEVFARAILN